MKTINIEEFHVFKNPELGTIRMIEMDDNLWWVLSDICQILFLYPSTEYLQDDEKTCVIIHSSGGDQQEILVNELGLYKTISRPDKPRADRLTRWILYNVIPSFCRQKREDEISRKYSDISAADA